MKKTFFNTDAIKKFTGLDDEQIATLLKTFYAEIRQSNEEITKHLDEKNWPAVRQAIHTMRPGFILFGLTQIDSLMAELLHLQWNSFSHERIQDLVTRYLEMTKILEKEIEASSAL